MFGTVAIMSRGDAGAAEVALEGQESVTGW